MTGPVKQWMSAERRIEILSADRVARVNGKNIHHHGHRGGRGIF